MVATEEINEVKSKAPFIPITTFSTNGEPHMTLAGKIAEVRDWYILEFAI